MYMYFSLYVCLCGCLCGDDTLCFCDDGPTGLFVPGLAMTPAAGRRKKIFLGGLGKLQIVVVVFGFFIHDL